MDKVFILYEERESSQFCCIKGVWNTKKGAISYMKKLIESNNLYSQFSNINLVDGYSESDPMYNENIYSNYYIKELTINN